MLKNCLPKKAVKSGFTLIELLIVIMIIAIITLFAVGSYAGVQLSARLDFAADSVVSSFKEAVLMAKSGEISEVGDDENMGNTYCYALKIEAVNGDGTSGVYSGRSEYIALDNTNPTDPTVDQCIEVSAWRKLEVFNENVVLNAVNLEPNLQADDDSFEIYFKPPFANVAVIDGGEFKKAEFDSMVLSISRADNQSPEFTRKLVLDLKNKSAYRVAI